MDIRQAGAVTNAYADVIKRAAENAAGMADGGAAAGGSDFAGMVKDAVEGAMAAGRVGEQASVSAIAKEAELVDVVTAVTNAEIALETMVAVRDRVVAAYQEIMRMPI